MLTINSMLRPYDPDVLRDQTRNIFADAIGNLISIWVWIWS